MQTYFLVSEDNAYIPNEKDDERSYILVDSPSQHSANTVDTANHVLRSLGYYNGSTPPSLTPRAPPKLSRHATFGKAGNDTTLLPTCFCDIILPENGALHPHQCPPNGVGRTQHFCSADPKHFIHPLLAPFVPLLMVPDTFNPPAGEPTTSQTIHKVLDTLKQHLHETAGPKHEYQYLPWLHDFKRALESHLRTKCSTYTRQSARATFPPHWEAKLKTMNRQGLNIATSDKGKHILFACTSLSQSLTTNFMTNSGRFEPTQLTEEQIYDHHTRSLRVILHNNATELISPNTYVSQDAPSLNISLKDHKQPPLPPHKIVPPRPVMRHDDRGPVTANKFLQLILKTTLAHFKSTDTHFPVVNSVWDTQTRIPKQMQAGDQMVTLDVESAYDNLTHYKTYQSVAQAIDENFDSHPGKYLSCKKNITWIQTQAYKPNNPGHFDRDKAKRLCLYLLTNDYCKASGRIYWSKKGIPMGAKPSSCLLDISLYILDRRAIDISLQLQPLLIYCRYQDDILTNLHITMMPILRELYMQAGLILTITTPTSSKPMIPYLDMSIYVDNTGVVHTEFFNKSMALFPRDDHLQHKHSAISSAAHSRLLKDLIRRIYKTTSNFGKFLATIRETTKFYQAKSLHTQTKVTKVTNSVLSSTRHNRYDLTQLQIDALTF
jgi:hypothetical protein